MPLAALKTPSNLQAGTAPEKGGIVVIAGLQDIAAKRGVA
jgi:hypothetical protein